MTLATVVHLGAAMGLVGLLALMWAYCAPYLSRHRRESIGDMGVMFIGVAIVMIVGGLTDVVAS